MKEGLGGVLAICDYTHPSGERYVATRSATIIVGRTPAGAWYLQVSYAEDTCDHRDTALAAEHFARTFAQWAT